jgi:predicted RNase H-like HicB family nuclease
MKEDAGFKVSAIQKPPSGNPGVIDMRYRIALRQSGEGFSVSVPGLPGCWSQGSTESEAIENIKDAIREYLLVVDEQLRDEQVREIDVSV